MKILITGAGGRIGKQLAAELAAEHELVLLDRDQSKTSDQVKRYRIELTDPSAIKRLILSEKPQIIIHLAAIMGPACEADPSLAQRVNVDATRIIAELASANAVKKLIFASTAAVYHQTELTPTDEEHNVDPKSVYGKTKLEAERLMLASVKESDTEAIILRLFNVYGPEFDGSLINKLIGSKPQNPVMLHGLDNYYRDYVHINDVVKAFRNVIDQHNKGPAVLNIGSGKALSNGELIVLLQKHGLKPQYKVTEERSDISWADISKARAAIGFDPKTELILDNGS